MDTTVGTNETKVFDIQFRLVRSGWMRVEARTEAEARELAEHVWSHYPNEADWEQCRADFDLDEDEFEVEEIAGADDEHLPELVAGGRR